MKILYASGLSPNDTSLYRLWALERLGHHVIPFNAYDYESANPLVRKITYRLSAGPAVDRLNRDLLSIARQEKPDLLWTDKLLSMRPKTLDRLRAMGIATVSYMIDNPFGPRRDPGWRLYMKDIPHYDLHVVQRDKNILDYTSHGARDVIKIQTAYEPTLQYPPPEGWSDADRNRG
ncbi:MAG: glycosyltransferase family 1 protein, partial [Edaphobacter sp.]